MLGLAAALSAHDLSTSESRLSIADRAVHARLSFDLLMIPGVDANRDRKITYDELDASIEHIFSVVQEHYRIAAGRPPSRITLGRYELADDHGVTIELAYTFDDDVRRVQVTATFHRLAAPSHQHLVSADVDGRLQRAMLSAAYPAVTFDARGTRLGPVAVGGAVVVGLLALAGASVLRWRGARGT